MRNWIFHERINQFSSSFDTLKKIGQLLFWIEMDRYTYSSPSLELKVAC